MEEVGGEDEGMRDILGAKVWVRRFERRRGCQVIVIESGKFLAPARWLVGNVEGGDGLKVRGDMGRLRVVDE